MMKIIQITNTYKGEVLEIVKKHVPEGFEIRTLQENSVDELAKNVSDADYILASGRVKIDERVLVNAPKLKMIQRTGVGIDTLDLEALNNHNIPVYVNKGVNSESVAEHSVLMILACLRKLNVINDNTKKGIWKKQAQGITTFELYGKKVGMLGMGNIGQKTARLISAFGAQIIYYDKYRQSEEVEKELGIKYDTLENVLKNADIVSLHCPLTEDTRHVINSESIALMKDGVVIVNTARGSLIDEEALYNAIKNGKVAYAGLDVHEKEPIPEDDKLMACDNVIVTPHIGGVTYDSFDAMMKAAMRNIELYDLGRLEEIEELKLKVEA